MTARHRKPAFRRSMAVERMRQKLRTDSFPRTQMLLIVLLTGGCGLLASFALLLLGMNSMALRYLLALEMAYLCFLFFIWLWLRTHSAAYWLTSTVRRTALPFVITAVFLAGTGTAMAACAPGIHSVGPFVKEMRKGHHA